MPGKLEAAAITTMSTNGEARTPLSIAYVCPGWPPSAFSNGVVTTIGALAPILEGRGHRVTIVAGSVVDGEVTDESIYDLSQSAGRRNIARRASDWIGYRVAPRWTFRRNGEAAFVQVLRRAHAERGVQIVEMEEARGWARRVCERTPLLVTVRLHGPWFLNGTVIGVTRDAEYRERVRAEGEAI